jgi:hypothetical protein
MSEHESRRRPEIGGLGTGAYPDLRAVGFTLLSTIVIVGLFEEAKIATSKGYALANQLPKRKPKAFRIAVRSGG